MKVEELHYTNWDVSCWTTDQKVKWQRYMESLGFYWKGLSGDKSIIFGGDVRCYQINAYDLTFTYSYMPDLDKHPYRKKFYTDLFPESKKEGVKGNYINTKWDASQWSEGQKIKWVDHMESLGFRVDQAEYLKEDYYFLRDDYDLDTFAYFSIYKNALYYNECKYEDVFPNEEPVPENSVGFEYNSNNIEGRSMGNLDLFNKLISTTKDVDVTFTIDKGLVRVSSENLGLNVVVDSTEGLEKVLETLEFLQQKQLTPEPLVDNI